MGTALPGHVEVHANSGHEPLALSVVNDRAALEPARQAVLDFLLPHALGRHALFNVELILEETLTNVIRHAFTDDAKHQINLSLQVEPGEIVMRFEDDGIAFNPLNARPTPLPTSIDEAAPGGHGLMLVRKHANSIAYERRDGRNCLTIRVARA
jgi:serine/threonine-protein kinase RsbW